MTVHYKCCNDNHYDGGFYYCDGYGPSGILKKEGQSCNGSNDDCLNSECHRIDRDGNNYKCCAGVDLEGQWSDGNYLCVPGSGSAPYGSPDCKIGFYYCDGYPIPTGKKEGQSCNGSNDDCLNSECHRIDRDGNNYKCCDDNYLCGPDTPGDCKTGFYYCDGYPTGKKEGQSCNGSNDDCLNSECHRIDRDGNNYKCCDDNYLCYPWTPGDCKSGFYYCNGYCHAGQPC